MRSAFEKLCDLLVAKGVLTQVQLDSCLREYGDGRERTLTDIVISRGYATREVLSASLEFTDELSLVCPKCRTRHATRRPKLEGHKCRKCGTELEYVDIVPSKGQTEAAAPAAEPSLPPEVVEARKDPRRILQKYTLLEELGRGGMAVVYKAWDGALGTFVALKIIRTQDVGIDDAKGDRQVQQFLQEARTALKLQHPHIVRVHDLGHSDDRYFLSMELVEGGSLASLLKPEAGRRAGSAFHAFPKRFLVILRDVARALDYAHHQQPPIVHRDVKPQNILVDAAGNAKLVDFGIAKEMGAGPGLTLTGMTKGTPAYMAPEQAGSQGGKADPRTDVHALGVILYEFLAGRLPFDAATEREILNKVVNEDPAPPSRAAGPGLQVQLDLEAVCLKALSKEKGRRYLNAGRFADEIDRFFSGEPVLARPAGWAARGWRWTKRRWQVLLPAAAAVVMTFVALAALVGKREGALNPPSPPDGRAEFARRAAELDVFSATMDFDAAIRKTEEFLVTADPSEAAMLRQRLGEYRVQAAFLEGLLDRIRKKPIQYSTFPLKSEVLGEVRVLDAVPGMVVLRQGDKLRSIKWSDIEAGQVVKLAGDAWPDIDGSAALGLGIWCLARGLTGEAAMALRRPGAAQVPVAERALKELDSKKPADPNVAAQVARIVSEADAAFAKGDLVIARARLERALTLDPRSSAVLDGLERIRKAGEDSVAKALASPPEPVAAKTPKSVPSAVTSPALPKVEIDVAACEAFGRFHAGFAGLLSDRRIDAAARLAKTYLATTNFQSGSKSFRELVLRALVKLEQGRLVDPDLKALGEAAETWLDANPDASEADIFLMFDLRDLTVMAFAWEAIERSIEWVALNNIDHDLATLGKPSRAIVRKGGGSYSFNRISIIQGRRAEFGTPVSLRSGNAKRLRIDDLAMIWRSAKGVRTTADEPLAILGEALLWVYEAYPDIPGSGVESMFLEAARLSTPRDKALVRASRQFDMLDGSLLWSGEHLHHLVRYRKEYALALKQVADFKDGESNEAGLKVVGFLLDRGQVELDRLVEKLSAGRPPIDAEARVRERWSNDVTRARWARGLGLTLRATLLGWIGSPHSVSAAAVNQAIEYWEAEFLLGGADSIATMQATLLVAYLHRFKLLLPSAATTGASWASCMDALADYRALKANPSVKSDSRLHDLLLRGALLQSLCLVDLGAGGTVSDRKAALSEVLSNLQFVSELSPAAANSTLALGLKVEKARAIALAGDEQKGLELLEEMSKSPDVQGTWVGTVVTSYRDKKEFALSRLESYWAVIDRIPSEARIESRMGTGSFPSRSEVRKKLMNSPGGPTALTEQALAQAVEWLIRHQEADGSWKATAYVSRCGSSPCAPNPGVDASDAGVTGLAVLALLGAGYTPSSQEQVGVTCPGKALGIALRWLMDHQAASGDFDIPRPVKYMYSHMICTLALVEAYGMTGSARIRRSAQRALDAVINGQNHERGWRYSFLCGDNDSSVTGWGARVFRSAEQAGLTFPERVRVGIRNWMDEATESSYGRTGYDHRGSGKVFIPGLNEQFDHHEALTAMGVVARIFTDRTPSDPRLAAGCDLLMRDLPEWGGNATDFYYWHQGTQALFEYHGQSAPAWKTWNAALTKALLTNQNPPATGCRAGSWEPVGRWCGEGGRVYATALNALTLSMSYSYPRMLDKKK